MTSYKHKARGVPGGYQLKAGTLIQLTAASAILTTAERGDGTAGTFHAPEDAEVISTASFGVLPHTGTYDVSDVAEGNIIVGASIGGVAGAYPLTATTQAADAAILEAEKAYLLATKTITFGASSVVGTLAVSNVLTAVTGGTFDATNLSVGNVIQDVTFGVGLTGTGANLLATHTTYLSLEAGRNSTTAAAGDIVTGESVTIAGVTINGSLDMSLWTEISGIVAVTNVRKGVERYPGGSKGTCYVPSAEDVESGVPVDHTTGAFSSPPVGKVLDDTEWGGGGHEFDGTYHEAEVGEVKNLVTFGALQALTGTYSPGGTFVEGQADQLATDQTAVGAVAGSILTTVVGLLGTVDGTLDLTLYTLTSGIVWPAVGNVLVAETAWGPTGAEYAGTFDEAARNTDPGEANVSDGVTYKILNVGKEGTLVGGDYATGYAAGKAVIIAALVLPATYLVDAPTMYGVDLAGYEAYYLEGTGLNQTTLTAALAAAGLTLPTGTYVCTWTVNDGTTVLQGATVSFWLSGVLKGTGTTGVAGTVAMSLDAGTYTVAITCDGYTFASTTHAVSSTASTWTKTFSMSSVVWPASTVPGTTTVRWRVRKTNRAWAGVDDCTVYMGIAKGPGVAGTIYNGDNLDYDSDTTDADGYVYFANTPKGATVAVKTATDGQVQFVKIPADCGSTFEGLELIGSA